MNELEQLRDLMNRIDNPQTLTEASGIGNRKPGDTFVPRDANSSLPDIRMDEVNFYPDTGGKYDPETWVDTFDQIEAEYPDIIWVNNPPLNRDGGFGTASFTDNKGKIYTFGKYFKTINANKSSNTWNNQTGIPNYKYGGKAVIKNDAGMQPADILTQLENLTPEDVVEQIAAKFGDEHPLTNLAEQVARGTSFPISIPAIPNIPFEAFRDYFTEILHPMALKSNTYTGNAHEAEELFLTNGGFTEASISFNTSKTEGLSDSMLSNTGGERLQISSKAGSSGSGAAASVKNLSDALVEMRKTNLPNKFYSDNGTAINVIETIGRESAYEGPLALALQYKLINQNEAQQVRDLRQKAADGELSYMDVRDGNYLNKRLKDMYMLSNPAVPERADAYNAMTYGIAKKVVEKVNSSGEFSKAASSILNNSALVQVYTKASQSGNNWVITDFNSKFPSSAVTDVLLNSKNYATTKNNGKFAFSIGKDGAKAEKEVKPKVTKPKQSKEQKKAASKRTAQAQKSAEFGKQSADTELYGREKSSKAKGRDSYDNWFNDRHPPGSVS